jgi:hypothetical protein
MAFVAFLDACVLFPPNLRDDILTIAETGICQIRWSPDVLDEMYRNIVKQGQGRALSGYSRRAVPAKRSSCVGGRGCQSCRCVGDGNP